MVEHKRLVSRVKRQRKALSSSYRDEKVVEPTPNRANFQSRVLGTLLTLFCLKGPGFLCTPSFLRKTGNFKSRACVLLVVLLPLVFLSVTAQAADGDLRLCDITDTDSCTVTTDIGRLEVHYSNEWAGVCDDYFTDNDAEIACGQLNYANAEFAKTLRRLDGPSLIDPSKSDHKTNNKFWLDDLLCDGDETRLIDCPRNGNDLGQHNCRSSEHAGVICSITAPDPPGNLEAEPEEQSMITLRWRAPNSYVEGYKIEVSEDGGNNWTDLEDDTGNTDTTYTHSGLSSGDTRHYRVSAINSEGTSNPSNIADATIPGPPDEPGTVALSSPQPQVDTALTATLTDPDGSISSVTWEWHRSTDQNNWGSPITGATSASYTPVTGDVGYYLRATASYSDGQGSGKSAQAVSQNQVQAAPVSNSAPEFSGTTTTRSVDENAAEVNVGARVEATDADSGDTLTYSLGGTDAASFDIEGSTGQMKTKNALNFESKSSYSVVVTARDLSNASDTITVTIEVNNVDEPGTVTLSSPEPRVTMEVTATLSDPDGSVSSVTWEWHRSTDQNNQNSWTPISGETSDRYTPGVDDELRYLRATASYTDPEDSGKTAHGVSDNVVPDENWPPEFSDETATRSVAENTDAGENIGDPFTATEPERDTLTYSLGGTDAASFAIETIDNSDGTYSGQIKTKNPLNYEHKNSYLVDVIASDSLGVSDSISVTISVTDLDEDGTVTLSPVQPQVGTELTASLSDPDTPVSGVTWKWYKSSDLPSQNNWNLINNATSASYTPVAADEDDFLRATASYTDRHGSKTAHGVSDNVVRVAPVTNNPPEFPSNTPTTFLVAENTPAEENVGEVTATDSDTGDVLTYSLGGTDGNSFRLADQTSGLIQTYAALNYETKNSYSVTVTATDPSDASAMITVTINVDDVDEPAIFTLSPSQPRVGSTVRTTLTEPDGQINNVRLEWHRSLDKSRGSWSEISGATLEVYTPVADDVGYYLRATAFYDGTHGPQSPEAVSANPVLGTATTTNNRGTRSPLTTTVPHAPSGLMATPGNAEVTLSWMVPNDGGSAIKYYEYNVNGGAWTSTGGKSTSYTVTGLINGQPYEFRVRAVNSVGPGAESKPVSIAPATVPGAPRNLGGARGNGEVTLSWDVPDDDGGSAIERYEYKVDSAEWVSTGGTTTTYTVTGLASGQTYEFRVRAVNDVGPGAESAPVSVAPATVPGAPLNLAGERGNGEVTLSWDAPADDGGSDINDYEYKVDSGGWVSTGGTTTTYTVTGLASGQTYEFRVRAVNDVGPGAESAPVSVAPATVPGAPRNLAGERGNGEVTLSWDAPDDDGGSAIERYEYKVDSAEWVSTGGKSTNYTVTGLTSGQPYEFKVRAVNDVGPGAESAPVSVAPATVPGAPRNLTLTPGDKHMMLRWERPADNGGLPITGYQYSQREENGSFGSWISIDNSASGEANESSYAVTGLKNGTVYSFRARAVNAVGPGEASAEATAEVSSPTFRRVKRANLSILPTFGRTMARNSVDALTWRLDSVLSGSFERTGMFRLMDQHAGLHEAIGTDIWDDPDQWEELSLEEMLYGSSFIIKAGVMLKKPKEHPKEHVKRYAEEAPREYIREYPEEDSADENMWINEDEKPVVVERKGDIGFWGKADYNNLSVSGDELFAWDGKMVSGYMGVDRWVNEKVLTGLSVSLTKGNFDYTDATPGEEGRGDYYVKMLSVSPYVSWFLSNDVYLWSALGYGRGEIDIDDEEAQSVVSSNLSYKSVAAGGSGRLFDVGDTTFSLKSEAFKVWMDVEGDDYLIDELSVGVHQLRLSMEGSYEYRFASGTWFNPLVEVALRHDGGDGETGTGVELGGGFLYENPNLGLSVSGRGRWLAAHSSQEFSQWGVGGAVIFDTGADKRGALFSVAPEWGDTSSGVEGLWERGVEGLSSKDGGDAGMHLDAEFGYGLSALGGDGLLTPYSGLRLGGDGRRQYRLGSRLDLGRSASLSLETERRQSDTTKPEHGIMLRGKLNF